MKFNFGAEKTKLLRLMQYWQGVNSILILLIFVGDYGWHWWYLLFIPVGLVSVRLFTKWDTEVTFRQELDFLYERHPIKREIDAMRKDLNQLRDRGAFRLLDN